MVKKQHDERRQESKSRRSQPGNLGMLGGNGSTALLHRAETAGS